MLACIPGDESDQAMVNDDGDTEETGHVGKNYIERGKVNDETANSTALG